MNKEKCISIGKELKKNKNRIKTKMNHAINLSTIASSRDTISELIECCLLCEIECQELINIVNGSEEEQKNAIKYTCFGYTQG